MATPYPPRDSISPPPVPYEVRLLGRLNADDYDKLVRSLPSTIMVSDDTSPMAAGYMLGVQRVLQVLREGWVIE